MSRWIFQNSGGQVVCPYRDEDGFVVKKWTSQMRVCDALTFDSEDAANEWHDEHLLNEDGEYRGEWKDFYAYQYEDAGDPITL